MLTYRVSPDLARALAGARELALAEGSSKVTTRHLLHASLHDPDGAASRVVRRAGALLDAGCTKGGPPTEGHLQFAPATKDAITRAMARAEVDGGPVDTAHLLAGVLGDPTLASAVASLGVDVGALTRAVTQDAAPPEGGHDTFWPPWSADR